MAIDKLLSGFNITFCVFVLAAPAVLADTANLKGKLPASSMPGTSRPAPIAPNQNSVYHVKAKFLCAEPLVIENLDEGTSLPYLSGKEARQDIQAWSKGLPTLSVPQFDARVKPILKTLRYGDLIDVSFENRQGSDPVDGMGIFYRALTDIKKLPPEAARPGNLIIYYPTTSNEGIRVYDDGSYISINDDQSFQIGRFDSNELANLRKLCASTAGGAKIGDFRNPYLVLNLGVLKYYSLSSPDKQVQPLVTTLKSYIQTIRKNAAHRFYCKPHGRIVNWPYKDIVSLDPSASLDRETVDKHGRVPAALKAQIKEGCLFRQGKAIYKITFGEHPRARWSNISIWPAEQRYGYWFTPFNKSVLGMPLSKVPAEGVIVPAETFAKNKKFYDEVSKYQQGYDTSNSYWTEGDLLFQNFMVLSDPGAVPSSQPSATTGLVNCDPATLVIKKTPSAGGKK